MGSLGSYIDHLECSNCNRHFSDQAVQTYCQECNAPLLARYDLVSASSDIQRDGFKKKHPGMWRWQDLLPVRSQENIVTLGEGDTPALHAQRLGEILGLENVFIKDEGLNPTGSFKARGISAAISKAKELGIKKVAIPTAGNAGGSLAAYAARGGIQASIFMPEDTPFVNKEESRITGAKVTLVKGLISDASVLARKAADREGLFDLSTFKEPYRTEGKKIMGYELAEFFKWELPDVIIYPTGGGTGLVGMWKAFQEIEDLGWMEDGKRPKMVSVQAEGCAPVVKAFQAGAETCQFWEEAHTIASGLKVPKSFADRLILNCLRESNGTAVAVSDKEILNAQRKLAETEGIFAAPEGAATIAALEKLVKEGWIKEEKVVLFNTGMGIKYIG
jgi:threonine synthase